MPDSLITDEIPTPSDTPLKALFRHAAERPNLVALIIDDEEVTYRQLATDVAKLSNGLRRAGILPGQRISVLVRPSPIYAVFMFAAMMTGGIVAPLKTELTACELNDLLRMQRPTFLIHDGDLQDIVLALDPKLLTHVQTFTADNAGAHSWTRLLDNATTRDVVIPTDIDAVCLLLATSGTTGKPKLVAYSQRAISHVVGSTRSWTADEKACVIGYTSVAHASGTVLILATIINGRKEVLLRNFDEHRLLDVIERHSGTMMFVPPFLCMRLVKAQCDQPRDVRSFQICLVGGDSCRPDIAEAFEATFKIHLQNTYALTECIGSTTYDSASRDIRGVPGRTRLVDTKGTPVAFGEVGELETCGPNLSLGVSGSARPFRHADFSKA